MEEIEEYQRGVSLGAKSYNTNMNLARFYGETLTEATNCDLQALNKQDVCLININLSFQTLLKRLIGILQAVMDQSSSHHHSTLFIKCIQRSLFYLERLNKQNKNAFTLDEHLIRSNNSLESIYDEVIVPAKGFRKVQQALWRWCVSNSKVVNTVVRKYQATEAAETHIQTGRLE